MNSQKYTSFATDFTSEISKNTLHVISQFPVSIFWVFLIFSFDPMTGNRMAKLMFVFGFLLLIIAGYGLSGIVFPAETKKAVSQGQSGNGPLTTMLFGHLKEVSFFSFLLSYILAYWAVLNWTLLTENNVQISVIYLSIFILSMFFYGYVLEGDWTSMLVGSSFGFLFGASWAYLAYQYITQGYEDTVNTSQMGSMQEIRNKTGSNKKNSYNEQSADMVCRAFRV